MSDAEQEAARLVHNNLAPRLAAEIICACPDFVDRVIILESVILGVIGQAKLKPGGDAFAVATIFDGVAERMEEQLDPVIEHVAVALAWSARPALPSATEITPRLWWGMQSEDNRRMHYYRARIAIEAYEELPYAP